MTTHHPPPLAAFAAPAAARPALWRTLAGALFAAALWLFALGATLPLAARAGGFPTRPGVLLYLASFAALLGGVVLAARLLQRRAPTTLVGPGGIRPRAFAVGVAVVALVALPAAVAALLLAPPERQLAVANWMAWLPLALPAILVQSAAEEVAFRGYLMQSLAARFQSPWIWWVVPSMLFGLLHWNPADLGANAALAVATTTTIGLALADVTARTGSLSAAIGLHFANNVVAMLVLALPSPVSGLSLFLLGVEPSETGLVRSLLLVDLASVLTAWGGWRLWRLHSGGPGHI